MSHTGSANHASDRGEVVLISCYELGHQPLGIALPAAHLQASGYTPRLLDIAVDDFHDDVVRDARLVAISVPMHTALRLGVGVARRVRQVNPQAHICFFGLYAALHERELTGDVADSCIGANVEAQLVSLAAELDGNQNTPDPLAPMIPSRGGLPAAERYAHLELGGELRTSAAVATTHGCKHTCRHCPLTPVYKGRFVAIPANDVMGDIEQLAVAGVRHIDFADPDFLNGPTHALRIARRLHDTHPDMTFSYTAKVEHLLAHRDVVVELHSLGALFVVSALESFNDHTLTLLDKGHTHADALEVIRFFRGGGMTLRPSFVPFNPWDTIEDFQRLLDVVASEGLVESVDAVQYAIRLLLPQGSPLLTLPEMRPHLGAFDAARFTFEWRHPQPDMDDLQQRVQSTVETGASSGRSAREIFAAVYDLAGVVAGRTRPVPYLTDAAPVPRMTEPWFC